MYKLTKKRFEAAKSILDDYRYRLHTTGSFSRQVFESELRSCWQLDHQELKAIIKDLAKLPEYQYLAAYYMEDSSGMGAVSEFQPVLADLYGITSYYHSEDREEKRKSFWERMPRQ